MFEVVRRETVVAKQIVWPPLGLPASQMRRVGWAEDPPTRQHMKSYTAH
jgi:hypothetical protein